MNKNKKLFDLLHSKWYNAEDADPQDLKDHIEKHRQLDKLLPHSQFFYAVLNFHTYEYEFLGRGQYLLTGYPNEHVQQLGVRFQMQNILSEDGELIVKESYDKFHTIIKQTSLEERTKLVLQNNYRFRHKEGHLLHLLEQVWPVKLDQEGKPSVGVVHINELPLQSPFRMQINVKKLLDDRTYEEIYSRSFPEAKASELTSREKDIVKMIADGFNSKSIAEAMSLSYHTVRTHRRNILRKLGLNTTSELVGFAYLNNLA